VEPRKEEGLAILSLFRYNTKMDLEERGNETVDWILVVKDRDQ
jgi:hypothetical protein